MADDWITTHEAVEISNYHPIYLRTLLREQRIRSRKFGRTWQVSKSSLLDYIEKAQKSSDKRFGAKE